MIEGQPTRAHMQQETKPGEEPLLESLRGLLGKVRTANGSLLTIEDRLEFRGTENEDTKIANADVRSYLMECHKGLDDLEDRIRRIIGILGE